VHQCPTCGKHHDDTVRFCPDDGTPLTDTAASSGQRTPTHVRPAAPELQLPVVVGNRYRLEQCLGGGGMAKVYRAVDQTLEREVAVKLINAELRTEPEFDARFHREARIASQLADPHIIVVHDFGIDAALGPYLVMELLKGTSLREHLATQGPMPLKSALQLSAQLMLALIHAHDKGIVHRDIKPDNIFLLNQSGVRLHVRVLDFGIARIYRRDEPASSETLTKPGGVVGTPRYMSPEQLAGQPVDARSDLYSAALVIHEALTGQLPYVTGGKLAQLCPEATAPLQELLDHCLKPNPNERPASAIEVYLRLSELGKASGILLLPPGAIDKLVAARKAQEPTVAYMPKPPLWRRRMVMVWGLLAVLLLAIAATVALVHWLKPTPEAPDQESLFGLKIGDDYNEAVARFGQPPEKWLGYPTGKDARVQGHVLKDQELGPGPDVTSVAWPKEQAALILRKYTQISAIVARAPGTASARGLKIGATETQLEKLYLERPAITTVDVPASGGKPARWIKVYRYDALGIGFEVEHEKVTGITLYPAE
jgi:tRNA A-37 threonylcarbamoyl transferase component Bud32